MALVEITQSEPLVSIILPVFNNEETLAKALDSVLAQTLHSWELIIVDDGSTDRSLEIATSYCMEDGRIRCLAQANSGPAHARNMALRVARGKYIALLDGDDQCFANRLKLQVDYLSENPEVDVLGGAILEVDSRTGRELGVSYLPRQHESLVRCIQYRSPFFTPTVMARREFFDYTGGFAGADRRAEDYDLWIRGILRKRTDDTSFSEDLRRGQDFDLWLRAARTFRYGNLSVPLVRYRRRVRPTFRDAWCTAKIVWRNRTFASGPAAAWYVVRPFLSVVINLPLQYVWGSTTWLRRMSRGGT